MAFDIRKVDLKKITLKDLVSLIQNKLHALQNRSQQVSKKEKILIYTCAALAVLLIIFYAFIKPKVDEYQSYEAGLARAKSGYNFILQNASKVTAASTTQHVDTTTTVEDAINRALQDAGIKDAVLRPGSENDMYVEIEEAQLYSRVNQMIKILETNYGVTVDELTLDKIGEGLVYIANMKLIRLETEE